MLVSLHELYDLPFSFDDELDTLKLGDEIHCNSADKVTLDHIRPTLLNKSLKYPEYVYTHHKQVVNRQHLDSSKWLNVLSHDVFILPHGVLGIEFTKTHIYFTLPKPNKAACMVQVLTGELTIMLQRNHDKDAFDFDTHVSEAYIVKVSKGEKAYVPTGYMFTFINSTLEALVFTALWTENCELDYDHIRREQGLAYFLISKNTREEAVTNPRYRTRPDISQIGFKELADLSVSWQQDKTLYNLAVLAADDLLAVLI